MAAPSTLAHRLQRMLVMVPWLLERGQSTLAEVSERFAVPESEVARDLNLLMCCGLPPYSGDRMLTVMLDDDGSVMAWNGPYLNRPMRLTPEEGFAVLAAGRALMAVPGADPAGPLARALDKLEVALGGPALDVELGAPPFLDAVREAATVHRRLAVSYYSAWRDEITARTIAPLAVFSERGRWYTAAHDSASGSVRHFRVDRIRGLEPTGDTFPPPSPDEVAAARSRVLAGGPDTVEVVVELPASARWVVESHQPGAVEELGGGRTRVRLTVAGQRWLERLLLRAGPGAVVVEPAEMAGLAREAAGRLLARYRPA